LFRFYSNDFSVYDSADGEKRKLTATERESIFAFPWQRLRWSATTLR